MVKASAICEKLMRTMETILLEIYGNYNSDKTSTVSKFNKEKLNNMVLKSSL